MEIYWDGEDRWYAAEVRRRKRLPEAGADRWQPGGALEVLYDRNAVQCLLLVALFFALFALDVVKVALVPSSNDTAVRYVLAFVLVVFVLEIVICVLTKPRYTWNFFFWMDCIGSVSLVFDLLPLFGTDLESDGGEDGKVVTLAAKT